MRLVEEVVPHAASCIERGRIEWRRKPNSDGLPTKWAAYVELPEEQLDERLVEEGNRAVEIDSKTVRAVTSIAVGFTFLVVGGPLVFAAIDSAVIELAIGLVGLVTLLYLLDTAFLLFDAMRTVERHGFGTEYRIKRNRRVDEERRAYIAENLWNQETINMIRHNRNSAVFSTLRNVLVLFTVLTLVTAGALLDEHYLGIVR